MLFNSGVFLFYFLPLSLIGYQLLARFGKRAVIGFLALASIVFYSWWDWHFVYVLVGSMLVNFTASRLIAAAKTDGQKKFWLVTGITINLAALCYYKYLGHILQFFTHVGWAHSWPHIVLPLGISFFTFTQIAYLIDLSQGQATKQNIIEYALFVTFFPHLIAGPILHHKEMMPQFLAPGDASLKAEDMVVGLSWFVMGLAKKCIIADYFGPRAEIAFATPSTLHMGEAWLGIVTYSLQLYFDFSGYSDMAIGLARMFSIKFPVNFNSPYKAADIIDFWARWHMTLTRYLTAYLYNPISLSMNRARMKAGKKVSSKAARTVPGFLQMIAWPTIVTMFLAGIWHGAGFQFIIFGLLHGIYITLNHAWRLYRGPGSEHKPISIPTRVACVLLTYVSVLIAQVFFRAASTHDAVQFIAGMAGAHGFSLHVPKPLLGACILGLIACWSLPNTQQILGQAGQAINEARWRWLTWRPTMVWSVALGLLFFFSILSIRNAATFLYFQF